MAAIREAAEGQALEARHVTASSMADNLDDFIVRHNHLFSRMCDSNVVGAGEGGAGAAAREGGAGAAAGEGKAGPAAGEEGAGAAAGEA